MRARVIAACLLSVSVGCYAMDGRRAPVQEDAGADAASGPDASPDCGADLPCPRWCEAGLWGGDWSFETVSAPGAQALLVDDQGHLHVLGSNDLGLIHASDVDGQWAEDRLPASGGVSFVAAALRGRGRLEVVALREPPPERTGVDVLYWATVDSGAAEPEEILQIDDARAGVGIGIAIDAAGAPRVVAASFVGGLAEDKLHSGRLSGGDWTWTSVGLGIHPNPGTMAVAVDSSGSTHVVYYAGWPATVVHWTERDGEWTLAIVDTDVNEWLARPAIWIGSPEDVRVAYTRGTETWLAFLGAEIDTAAIGTPNDVLLNANATLGFDPSGVLHEAALVRAWEVVGDALLFARWEGSWTTWGTPVSFAEAPTLPLLAFGPPCCDDQAPRPYVGKEQGDGFILGTSLCLQ